MAPPISVPAELEVNAPSQTPFTCLLETSCAIGATLAEPVPAQRVSAVLPSPSRSSESTCAPPEQRWPRPGASDPRVKVLDSAPKEAPLRIVVLMLIHTSWPTPRLPLPAFQLQRRRVRPVPAKFGTCWKLGAGRPVPRSSKVQPVKMRSTGSRSVATRFWSGTGSLDCGALRTCRRQETVCPGLKGPPPERLSLAGSSCTNGPLRVKLLQVFFATLVGPAV